MTSGAILSRTASLGLAKLRFNFPNWGDEHNRNMEIIDAALLIVGVAFDGAWTNDTTFPVGSKVIDPDDATFWRALVAHTSPSNGTFAEARTAEPTYWAEIINVINFRGEWADLTAYQLNDIVFSGYKWAIVVRTHTSATSFDAGVSAGDLEVFFDATAVVSQTEAFRDAAEGFADDAEQEALAAANSASAANNSAGAALGSENAAAGHSNKAAQWAEEAEDVAVETGQFSARHHRIKAAVHESEAKDARDEAVNRLENAAGAVRHDVVQTLDAGEKTQARTNIGVTRRLLGTYPITSSNAAWAIPLAQATHYSIRGCGGGGAGGGAGMGTGAAGGGGGHSGAFGETDIIAVPISRELNITIGAGGSPGAVGAVSGGSGGNTVVTDGTVTVAFGGGNGGQGVAGSASPLFTNSTQTANVSASGGAVVFGGSNHGGFLQRGTGSASGTGGETEWGRPGRFQNTSVGNSGGIAATGFGAGGGGATTTGGADRAGGTGAPGIVFIDLWEIIE